MIQGLEQIMSDSVTFTPPQGGLNMWCKINRQVDDFKLLDEAIKREVLFVPGSVYGSDHNCIRLSFARPKLEEIIPGLNRLNEVIQFYCKCKKTLLREKARRHGSFDYPTRFRIYASKANKPATIAKIYMFIF